MKKTELKQRNQKDLIFGLKDISDIDPNSSPVIYSKPKWTRDTNDTEDKGATDTEIKDAGLAYKDKTSRALSILKKHGFKSKLFCRLDTCEAFTVNSDKWIWDVTPVESAKQMVGVPLELTNGIRILIHNGVGIESIGIGKPNSRGVVIDVVKDEALKQIKMASKAIVFSAVVCLSGLKKAAQGIKKAGSAVPIVRSLFIPDPVLLVRISHTNDWVEIGRWE